MKEPKWHHRLKRLRHRARIRLRALGKSQPQQKDLILLQNHHGSAIPLRARLRSRLISWGTMTSWQCRFCHVWQSIEVNHCGSCSRHWKQAQRTRSQSRSSHRTRRQTRSGEEISQNSNKPEDVTSDLFAKVPWVSTTPRARLPRIEDNGARNPEQPATAMSPDTLPPQPVLPPPPVASTVEDADAASIQAQLEALKRAVAGKKNVSPEVQSAIAVLEKEAGVAMPLTHGQLNQASKFQKQIKTMKSKIEELDIEWKKFAQAVQERYQKHQQLYLQQRQELSEQIQEKQKNLLKLQSEIQTSSQHLLEGSSVMQEVPEPEAAEAFEDMYPMLESMSDTEPADLGEEVDASHSKPVVAPFSRRNPVHTSPQKVAKTSLKDKTHTRPRKGDQMTAEEQEI